MNKIITSLFLITSFGASSTEIENLKNTPASKYDVLKVELETSAYALGKELHNKKIGESNYTFNYIDLYEDSSNIGLTFNYKTYAKYINKAACDELTIITNSFMTPEKLVTSLWPNCVFRRLRSPVSG